MLLSREKDKVIIIFDVDGHVVDSEALFKRAYFEVLRFYRYDDDWQRAVEKYLAPKKGMKWFCENMLGRPISRHLEVFNKFLVNDGQFLNLEDAKKITEDTLEKAKMKMSPSIVFKGMREMLAEYADNPYISLYFVSGSLKARILETVNRAKLVEFFDFDCEKNVYTGETFSQKDEVFKMIQEREGTDRNKMIFSGDSVPDMQAGKRFGIYTIGSFYGLHLLPGHSSRLRDNGAAKVAMSPLALKRDIDNQIMVIKGLREKNNA